MRISVFAFIAVICLMFVPMIGHASPDLSAANAIVMEQESGRVLFQHNAHDKQPIASITKLMTAIIAVESGQMDEKATASSRAVHTEGSSLYLEQGEKMKVEDMVYGMMLRSGNDAAVTLSEHIGGSVEGFTHLMNKKAAWIGMNDTHFANPHGLPNDNHYSTAYDMAILMQYAMRNEIFRDISKTKTYQADTRAYSWKNKNRLLTSLYPYCTGGKTGYTQKAGRTLVTTASKNGMDLIGVTLDAPDDWNDHIDMYEWSYDNYEMKDLDQKKDKDLLNYPLTSAEQQDVTQQTVRIKAEDASENINKKTRYYLNDSLIGEIDHSKDHSTSNRSSSSFPASFQAALKTLIGFDVIG